MKIVVNAEARAEAARKGLDNLWCAGKSSKETYELLHVLGHRVPLEAVQQRFYHLDVALIEYRGLGYYDTE